MAVTSGESGLKCDTIGSTLVLHRRYFRGFLVFDEFYRSWQVWNYLDVPTSGIYEYYSFMID